MGRDMSRELDTDMRKKVEEIINVLKAASLRCVAFSYMPMDGDKGDLSKIDDEGLTLLAFVGMKGSCQPDVRTAVEAYVKAGVRVTIVMGDNRLKVRAVAKECGIISNNNDHEGMTIEGQEFCCMLTEQQMEITADRRFRVMARSRPYDKLQLVQALKQSGHVVAVTGDNVTDVPALREADIGLSMGIQGTEVAKESSDIMIMNDNFDTVVTASRWGHCIFNNI